MELCAAAVVAGQQVAADVQASGSSLLVRAAAAQSATLRPESHVSNAVKALHTELEAAGVKASTRALVWHSNGVPGQ
jgi:hypothetical protein